MYIFLLRRAWNGVRECSGVSSTSILRQICISLRGDVCSEIITGPALDKRRFQQCVRGIEMYLKKHIEIRLRSQKYMFVLHEEVIDAQCTRASSIRGAEGKQKYYSSYK